MKRYSKLLIAVLLVVEFCFMFLSVKSYMGKDIVEIQEVNKVDTNTFAMYIENDEGNYEEAIDTGVFPEGYILNLEMTSCIDNKGNSISDILTSKDDKVMVKSNKTVFCYLYFDKDNRVYTQVKNDYKNSSGALLLSETESDKYPVYYYSGNITNNNILYANFCWKMVRTTETGGVKLIYNGVPDESEDGTLTCDNTGTESQIGTSKFNVLSNSLAYVGYMYNSSYKNFNISYIPIGILEYPFYNPGTYYYGDTVIWNGTEYVLSNSDGSEVTTYAWSDNYTNLEDKYTCRSGITTSCSIVYHVSGATNERMYAYKMTDGNYSDNYNLKLATSVTSNNDETYTLIDWIELDRVDWYKNYSNYKNYYYCEDLTSITCDDMYYSYSTTNYQLLGYNMSNVYKYGNSFKYENGKYTLIDTMESWYWPDIYNQINNNHYTCFNTAGECEEINYIHYVTKSMAIYITLNGGESVEVAINKMLYADDVNTIDSTMKTTLDTWYKNNIIDAIDSNSILYSSYLEDTIWCHNREISDLAGWNPNGGDPAKNLTFNYTVLECSNKLDQYTLKVEAGGTEGYGNNVLDYPIGLISYSEVLNSSSKGFLKSGSGYWLLSPLMFTGYPYAVPLTAEGYMYGSMMRNAAGVRPSVSLSNKVEIISGNGSVTTPYQIMLPSE